MLRHLRPALACLATLIALAATAPAAFGATTYAPNRFDDPISGGTDCTAPVPANGCSLRGAIAAAANGDTVQLAPGTYTLTQNQLSIAHDITLAGAGMRDTTIKQTALNRVIGDMATTLTIQGLTLTGGHVVGSNGPNGSSPGAAGSAGGSASGSAVAFSSTLKLTDVLVTANVTAAGNGGNGAAAAPGTGGNGGDGGFAGSAISGGASLIIVRSEISDNGALGGLGGNGADGTGAGSGGVGGTSGGAEAPISTGLSSTITITDSLISGNVATPGNAGHGGKGGPSGGNGGAGGLGNQPAEGGGLFTNGHLDMTNVTVTGNTAGGSAGGAGGAGTKAGTAGGAGGTSFGGNGGALGLLNGAAGRLDAVTLSANKTTTPAAASGGAAGAGGVAGAAGALVPSAGGNIEIYSATLTLRNTIVAAGVASDPAALNCDFGGGSTLTDNGHNIDDGHSCISIVTLGDRKDTPPLIGDLADNGGPTRTVALLAASPSLGGVGGPCVQLNGATPLDHDQRGLVRANPCDIGAFQHQNPQITLEPSIDGPAQVGQTVTCQRAGASGDLPFTHAIQWLLDGNPIAGQTTGSYAPVQGDVGHGLSCTDTVSNIYGSASATSLAVTVDPPPAPPAPPSGPVGPTPTPTPTATPKLTKLHISPSAIRRGHKGHVTFTLSAAAKVTFKLQRKTRGTKVGKSCVKRTHSHRHGASCTRLVTATGAPKAVSAKNGSDSVSWTPSKKLSPGSYVLTATPAHGRAVTKTFTIRR